MHKSVKNGQLKKRASYGRIDISTIGGIFYAQRISTNFLVFETEVFEKICKPTSVISEEVANCMIDISDKAEKILAEHAAALLKGQCGDIAKIHHRLDVAAFLLEELIKENKLIVPNEKTPICIWGVKA